MDRRIRLEQLIFKDYMKSNIGYQKDASTIITLVIKQISRGRFELVDNICEVQILLKGERRTVILSNTIKLQEFREEMVWVSPKEPSLDLLYNNIGLIKEPLLVFLKNYQEQFYKLGTEFENKYWYKFYSKTEIKEGMRELYQAGWIDYERQLENDTIIYDELGICGVWAMPYHMLLKCFNESCKERYGDRLFILKTVPECRYIDDGKEIIGDRFEVIEKYDLNSIEDMGKLFEHLLSLNKNEYETKISELNARIRSLESENIEAIDNQIYLSGVIVRYNRQRWLFLLIGGIIGSIICKFM